MSGEALLSASNSAGPLHPGFFERLFEDLSQVDSQIAFLAVIIVASVLVLDAVTVWLAQKTKESGLEGSSRTISMDGSALLPLRHYISERQGLAGRPDALIVENGFVIPVERKPLARKLRDRHVAQLLVYMRLVEEFEGKKPPYGYLILGPSCRKVKIDNSPKRQAWLQTLLDQMAAVLEGAEAQATPEPQKCQKCSVRDHCKYADLREEQVRVYSRSGDSSSTKSSKEVRLKIVKSDRAA